MHQYKITTWRAAGFATGNPNEVAAENTETGQAENTEEGTAEPIEAAYTMYATDTESIFMAFAADGTCQFHFTEYDIIENATWAFADGVLTEV